MTLAMTLRNAYVTLGSSFRAKVMTSFDFAGFGRALHVIAMTPTTDFGPRCFQFFAQFYSAKIVSYVSIYSSYKNIFNERTNFHKEDLMRESNYSKRISIQIVIFCLKEISSSGAVSTFSTSNKQNRPTSKRYK